MEITGLKTFKAVVDEGGIKGASVKMNTVQSNITTRIQKLEDELEAKLFRLVGRRLELTPSGQQLYGYAKQILQFESQAIAAIKQSKGSYELRIGMPETFAAVHMPLVLKALREAHPEIKLKMFTDTSDRLVGSILNSQVDCAVIGNAPEHEELITMPLVCEELVVVTPLGDSYEPIMFVRDEGCGYRKRALEWQHAAGRGDEELMVMSSSDGVLGCIAAGLGYTVIGKNMVVGSRYEKSLSIEPVSVGPRHVKISMVYRKDHPLEGGVLDLVNLFPERANLLKVDMDND